MLISDSPSLRAFCAKLTEVPYIACDTEFVRERTYYAKLSLIQIAHGEEAAAIDPLADGIDLEPLHRLMANAEVVKVFHGGSEDYELLLQTFGELPTPIYDTQIAASLCGSDAQIGYARLVKNRLGITLDKASQRTDWSRRPLSERQLEYALADVTHLCDLYEGLQAELEERGRSAWAAEEMLGLSGPSRYRSEPEEAYKKIRLRRPTRRALAILKALAAWREVKARSRNLPRPWVLKNDALAQLAQAAPRTKEALVQLSSLKQLGGRWRDGERVLNVITEALESPPDSWPELPMPTHTEGYEPLLKRLKTLLTKRCEEAEVATSVVATRRDLEALVTGQTEGLALMKGWRKTLFGAEALAMVEASTKGQPPFKA